MGEVININGNNREPADEFKIIKAGIIETDIGILVVFKDGEDNYYCLEERKHDGASKLWFDHAERIWNIVLDVIITDKYSCKILNGPDRLISGMKNSHENKDKKFEELIKSSYNLSDSSIFSRVKKVIDIQKIPCLCDYSLLCKITECITTETFFGKRKIFIQTSGEYAPDQEYVTHYKVPEEIFKACNTEIVRKVFK